MAPDPSSQADFRIGAIIFLVALLACACFFNAGNSNHASRYDAIYAIAEDGHFSIDRFLPAPSRNVNTRDWAFSRGRYYSNKAPGAILAGAAAYAPLYWMERCFWKTLPPSVELFNAWWINFWCSAVPAALLGLLFFCTLRKEGASPRRAACAALLLIAGTPLWPYSTSLFGHALAALLVWLALENAWSTGGGHRGAWWCGWWCGWAVLVEYPVALLLPISLAMLLWGAWRKGKRASLTCAVWWMAGGVVPILVYCGYHQVCFGNPFWPAVHYNNPEFMTAGATGGICLRCSTLLMAELLVGVYRGLLVGSPFLALAAPGFLVLWRTNGKKRRQAVCCLATCLAALAMNASFNGWHSGCSPSPRYMLFAVPCWCWMAAFSPWRSLAGRVAIAAMAVGSVVNMAAVVLGTTQLGSERRHPWSDLYGLLLHGGRDQALHFPGVRRSRMFPEETWRIRSNLSPGALAAGRKCARFADLFLLAAASAVVGAWLQRMLRLFRKEEWRGKGARPPLLPCAFIGILLSLWLFAPGDISWQMEEAEGYSAAFTAADAFRRWAPGWRPRVWGWQFLMLFSIVPSTMNLVRISLFLAIDALLLRLLARRLKCPFTTLAMIFLACPWCWSCQRPFGIAAFAPIAALAALALAARPLPAARLPVIRLAAGLFAIAGAFAIGLRQNRTGATLAEQERIVQNVIAQIHGPWTCTLECRTKAVSTASILPIILMADQTRPLSQATQRPADYVESLPEKDILLILTDAPQPATLQMQWRELPR